MKCSSLMIISGQWTATASFSDPSLLRHPFTRQLWHALPEHDFVVGENAGEKVSASAPMQVREGEETPTPASAGVGGFDGKEGGAC